MAQISINIVLLCLLAADLFAIETVRGVVRVSTALICPSACSQYYLEPDPTYQRTSLQGDFSAYLDQHVEVTGYRDNCSGCFIFIPTEPVTVLPPLVSVEDDVHPLPLQITLLQNYPNPFNPETKIRFTIQVSGFTTVKIYGVFGNEVATILRKELPPGTYTATWDGSAMPGGIYYYRLQTGLKSITRKMLLLK